MSWSRRGLRIPSSICMCPGSQKAVYKPISEGVMLIMQVQNLLDFSETEGPMINFRICLDHISSTVINLSAANSKRRGWVLYRGSLLSQESFKNAVGLLSPTLMDILSKIKVCSFRIFFHSPCALAIEEAFCQGCRTKGPYFTSITFCQRALSSTK